MKPSSILLQSNYNLKTKQTQGTSDSDTKWVQKSDANKVKTRFKNMQIKLLNMFTLAKSQLTTVYQSIVNKIKKIQKYLHVEQNNIVPSFLLIIQDIEEQIQQKIYKMTQNIQNSVVNSFKFDQLLSIIPDFVKSQYTMSSLKKINSISMSSNKLPLNLNNTIADIDSIGGNQYKNAIKIQPNDKRIQNLDSLSGRWDMLQNINLQNKQICRMVPLQTVIADNLQILNLSFNQIGNLTFINQAKYPLLRNLNLKKNFIQNLDGIQYVKFPNLKILNMSDNRIKKIDTLKQTHFPDLVELNLSNNKLEKADVLTECDFPKLQILNLDSNSLQSIDFIPKTSFYRLKILSFCFNNIRKIDCLSKCKFQKLEALLGYNNKIASIDFMEKCEFPMLKQIILNNNLITDIKVIQKMKFKNLAELDLENNDIQPHQVLCFVTKNDQCKKAKKKYPFIQL